MAEAAGIPVVPHSNEAHNLHIIFSRAPHVCPVVEYFPDVEPDTGNELFWKLFEGLPTAEQGRLVMNYAPGLGVQLRGHVIADLALKT
jgi:L-alanine-DL-glutamate epimerase-like enolase superfamily enzyme